jgi:photosystem II stability/assembly factor-like uncharacterized protein
MHKKQLALALILLCLPISAQTRPGGFSVLGPGGGGAMFHPTFSPHDPNTMLVACDMTGAYITHDGGKTWRMFNLRGVVQFFAFDPKDSKVIYAGDKALWRSSDSGATWKLVYPAPSKIKEIRMNPDHADETIVADPDPVGRISAFAIDPDNNHVLYAAGTKDTHSAMFVSKDYGISWKQLDELPETAEHLWVNPASPANDRAFIVAGKHLVFSRKSSASQSHPAPAGLTDVSAGFDGQGNAVLYGTASSGLYSSKDLGSSWKKDDLPGKGTRVVAVATSLHHPEVAYVSYEHMAEDSWLNALRRTRKEEWFGVAKTADAGGTWQLVWKEKETQPAANLHDAWITARFGPGWAGNPLALGVADQDANLALGTDYGRTLLTTDGGGNWTALYSKSASAGTWTSTGLDVTTNYGIHFDPFDPKRQFITYTDIGLFRSEDGGQSWQSSTAGVPQEWSNTTYWVVFDPEVRGRMWSVNSGTHDLPRPKMWRKNSVLTYKGGVCRSDDGGKTWVKSNSGMDETAPTHILLDRKSPVNARVFYVAAFGRGVYKSPDDGRTWQLKNKGITQQEPFAWRLAQDSNGTLYLVVARRSEDGNIGNDRDGALYRSHDGAEHWERVALPEGVNGPNGLAIDARNPDRIYLAAWARASGVHGDGGGVFVSNDAGKTWRQTLDRDRHVYDITDDPKNPEVLYAAGFESSAWRSTDRGEHWTRIPGFNFKWAYRVIPDPLDTKSVYITTFGGSVWHGRLDGKPSPEDIATPELKPGQGR